VWNEAGFVHDGDGRPPGHGPELVAPVFAAPEGASQNQLVDGLMGVAKTFVTEAAKQAGQNVGDRVTAWA